MKNISFGEMWATLTEEQREYFAKYIDKQRKNAVEIYIEQQCNIANVVESRPNEMAALKHAIDAIYFADNSDYLCGLYGVVRSLTGLDEPTEEDIKKLFKELNPK